MSTNNLRRQVFVKSPGGYDVLKIKETKIPSVSFNEVLVEVRSCGLNFYDNYIRHGLGIGVEFPSVLGLECSGIVRIVGSNVDNVKCGDRVVVHCPKGGALSDWIVANKSNVLVISEDIDFDEASAITINYLTAYFSLVEIGGLKRGASVFIQGAAGGVGWAATQIAKLYEDVTVIGVASDFKHCEIKSNGVDYALTYEQDIRSEVKRICPEGVSIVLQSMVGESFQKNQELLAPLGKIILIGAKDMVDGEMRNLCKIFNAWWNTKNISPNELIMNNRAVAGFNLNTMAEKSSKKFRETWLKMLRYLREGKIKPKIDSIYSFEQIDEACKRIAERRNIGKIIIKPVI